MSSSTFPRPPRRFAATLLAPVLAALATTLVAVAAFLFYVTGINDQRSLSRQSAVVGQVLADLRAEVPKQQESVAVWDDAIVNTSIAFDRDWAHVNLGEWMYDYFGHSRSYVLDRTDNALYAMNTGLDVDPSRYQFDRPGIEPTVQRFRTQLEGFSDRYMPGDAAQVPRVSEFASLRGVPSLISIMPIVAHSGAMHRPGQREYLLVSVVELNDAFAARLSTENFLSDGRFTSSPTAANAASYALTNAEGRIVGLFEWTPDRPGTTMLTEMLPILVGGTLVAGSLIAALLNQLWSSSRAIEAGHNRARHQALHDPLTGMPNRALFEETLEEAVAGAEKEGGKPSVLLLDLDRFKQINDTLGHQAGDATIAAVGKRLRELVREDDMVARIGGDEYAIISRRFTRLADAEALSAAIIEALAKPFNIDSHEAHVGASIGIVLGDQGAHGSDLMRKADIALYEAKAQGRNRAVVYREQMGEVLQQRHAIESALREALASGDQLSVAFQPVVTATDGTVIGAEALIRWQHPSLGLIPPVSFIPVAESTGLIEPLGEFVLRRAAALGARWPGMTLAVNVSPVQMRNPRFFQGVFDVLSRSGMRPRDLELEITENLLLDNEVTASEALRRFRTGGIRMALDDFGTGYSSLNYLKQYEVDRIKIDRSFIVQLGEGRVAAAIVRAMITLAHAMGVQVTAEGVETDEQAVMLRDIACNALQGYLFSPPVDEAAIEAMFADTRATSPVMRSLSGQRRAGAPSA